MNAIPRFVVVWSGTLLALVLAGGAPAAQGAPVDHGSSTADLPRWTATGPEGPVLLGDWFEFTAEADLDALDGGAAGTLAERVSVLGLGVAGVDEAWRVGTPMPVLEGERLAVRVPIQSVLEGVTEFDSILLSAGKRPVAFLAPVSVEVVVDLPPGRLPRLAEPKRGLDIPTPAAHALWWIVAIVLGLVLLGAAVIVIGRPVVTRERTIPPEVIAARALAHLRAHLPQTQDEVPHFIVRVSHVLRVYIEGAFHLRAPELTTEEFLVRVSARHDALAERRDVLESFLTLCDLVKFASHEPALSEAVALVEVAERFVDETHVHRPETVEIDDDRHQDSGDQSDGGATSSGSNAEPLTVGGAS